MQVKNETNMSQTKRLWRFSHQLQSLAYYEFENLILKILEKQPYFDNIVKSRAGKDSGYDLFADETISDNKKVRAVFQIKKTNLITPDYIFNIGDFWKSKGWLNTTKLYIITNGAVTNEAKIKAKQYDIKIWDLYKLNSLIENDLIKEFFEKPYNFQTKETREVNLSIALGQLKPGKKEWSTFQQLSCDIFSQLFSPPLTPPRFEHSDADKRNRRDMIYENSTEYPFWKSIRDLYRGYYIVVDAKNYSKPISKQPVIDVAHYLKPYGCGMFAVLITRKGANKSAIHAIKEQWIGNNKMIIVLDDNDMLEMLNLKQTNDKPEEIIRMKLADFRMGL